MAALTEAKNITYQTDTDQGFYPVAAATKIFDGAFVGEDGAGRSRPLVAGDKFQGIAIETVDNSSGIAGAEDIWVKRKGIIIADVAGAGVTSNDRPDVYASDDNTLTLTIGTNSKIGRVLRHITGTQCAVEFES